MNRVVHKHDKARKAIKGFDSHAASKTARPKAGRTADGGRRAMSVFVARQFCIDPEAPHFRMTARVPALSGGHVRNAARPARAAHRKVGE